MKRSRPKRLFCLLLALCLLFCLACQRTEGTKGEQSADTVIDAAGRMLSIPQERDSLTIASVYAVSVPFLVALGLEDRVVAINCKSRFWTDNIAALDDAGSVGRGTVDMEALANYAPSVLIHRANDPKTLDAVSVLGVEVLCIRAESMEDVKEMLRLLGRYFGREARAQEVIAYIDTKFAYIDSIVKEIPVEDRPKALLMGGELGRIAGGDMIQSWMIEKAGGTAVAADVRNDCNWANVGVETVFSFDPEYLFLTGSTALDYTAEEILEDSAWGAVGAVRDSKVYRVPSGMDCWDLPGVVSVIGTMWMLHKMHPEYFSAEELQKEIDEYYSFFFGRTFDAEYLGYVL